MAKGFKHGAGGGTSLNFKVVGNPQPENPKENTIWVDTDTAITGWSFSAVQPETPAEGMVCFFTAEYSTTPFNALKENEIQVYPISAKQYISDAWVEKEAKIYQNGAWVEIESPYVIFESGKGAVVPCNTKKASNGSISVTANSITTHGTGSYTDVIFYTVDKIYVSEYNTLELTGVFNRINTNENYTGFGVMTSTPKASAYTAHTWAASMEIDKPNTNKKTYIVDISNVNGAYYIAFTGADVDCTITDIKLRK